MANELSSKWGGLSDKLIAHLAPLDREGNPDQSEPAIRFAISGDGNLQLSLGWQSAASTHSAENAFPTIAALAQSGALAPLIDRLARAGAGDSPVRAKLLGSLASAGQQGVDQLRSRTGLTKLNSTMYFSSMPPAQISFDALFRAWSDPVTEVEEPLRKLLDWAVPQELASAGGIFGLLSGEFAQRGLTAVQTLLPSVSPRLLGLRYSGNYYAPMVIESLNVPITSPQDKNGNRVSCKVSVVLGSLTAWDRSDIKNQSLRSPS